MQLFKKKAKPEFNLKHPDIAPVIEQAFKAGGKVYYRFKEEKLIPAGRHKYIQAHLKEVDLRMDNRTLINYLNDLKEMLNGGSGQKKEINFLKILELVINMESRAKLAFEPAMVERLAAVVYFDDSEDLSTYDRKHGQQKIDHWKKHNVLDFFLTRPIGELLGLINISVTSLEDYIAQASQMIKDLTIEQQKLSSQN